MSAVELGRQCPAGDTGYWAKQAINIAIIVFLVARLRAFGGGERSS